jgi:predicted RNA-binding Zn ribbon-like protein
MTTQEPWARRMLFVSGRLSLDLAHSGGEGRFAVFERLHAPADLGTWLARSPLHLLGVAVTDADLDVARVLRAAIWNAANAIREGAAPRPEDVATINRAAATAPLIPELAEDGLTARWQLPDGAASALSTIARDAIDLFARRAQTPVRQCANPACPLLFVDGSRPGRRRWCAMERCGTMTKVARHRAATKRNHA